MRDREIDTVEAIELLEKASDLIDSLMEPRTIVIECSGGSVNAVHGLRDGDHYDVADWDDEGPDQRTQVTKEFLERMINEAKAQK